MTSGVTKLIVISAPSGAGKTTLCQRLLADFPQLTLSVSSTTRQPRGAEEHAKEYHFLSTEEFEKQIAAGRFAEWARVHGNYYGTSKDVIDRAFAAGKSVLLDIDVQGAESLRKAYPGATCLIFVSPPSIEELEFRLRARATDSEQSIQRRLTNAREEMARADIFDHVIINDQLDRAYRELAALVRKELGNG
ncbi:MAG: guanylate kinase [Bdellovibrionota bacterium]